MTIAVSAATGQLGSAILNALKAEFPDRPLIGLARSPERVTVPGVEARPGDYADAETFQSSLKGASALLLVSLNGPPETRIPLHRNAIAAAKAAGVQRIVYTSVQGAEEGTAFSPVIQSNRQTEADIRDCGLEWSIGRNGIYIEPDIDYIDTYRAAGEIANSAGDGLCGYTTRSELAAAYCQMLVAPQHHQQTYNLNGKLMTQSELVGFLNHAFDAHLTYRPMSVDAYRADRIGALGEMMGTIIAGIYEGIRNGAYDTPGDFEAAAGRPHISWQAYFDGLKSDLT